jgi:trk system potassium uptake protein TrkH
VLFRPDTGDLSAIALNLCRVLLVVAAVMLIPAVAGFALGETNDALAFVIAASVTALVGLAGELTLHRGVAIDWQHGMIVAAVAWVVAPMFGAIPLFLSGHYGSFFDAYFDAMSGFATAGLAVINDLDHVSESMNLWRHLTHFLGGQGLMLMALSLFAGGGGSVGMYVGEGREDRIVPNIHRTARIIWRVALVYALVGILALFVTLVGAGVAPSQAGFHAVNLFMAAFDTGGFSPNAAGIWLYHASTVEVVLGVLMIAGGLSFALHYHLWQRRLGELHRNIETRLLAFTVLVTFAVACVGLLRSGTYHTLEALLRRGLFHVVSAHSGTGFSNMPSRLFVTDWGLLAPAGIVMAMGIGAMAGSTAGGIKAIRIAVIGKAVSEQIRRLSLPRSAVTLQTYHSGTRQVLSDQVVRSALTILVLYLILYLSGAAMGLFYGYPFDQAMFESTSAAAAVGLSVGIVGPTMPWALQLTYVLQMWLGRLEFVAVLALVGFVVSAFRARV